MQRTLAALDSNRMLEGPSGRHTAEAQIKELHRQLMLKEVAALKSHTSFGCTRCPLASGHHIRVFTGTFEGDERRIERRTK